VALLAALYLALLRARLSHHLSSRVAPAGPLNDIKVITDKTTGRSKGFAYIEFQRREDVINALALTGQVRPYLFSFCFRLPLWLKAGLILYSFTRAQPIRAPVHVPSPGLSAQHCCLVAALPAGSDGSGRHGEDE
jgi:hypothetical protein